MSLERPSAPPPGLHDIVAAADRHILANALVGFLFAATGPLAILIAIGTGGGLTSDDIASWVFGSYGLTGVITIALSWLWRMPLPIAWTIPGAVLLIPAFGHLGFAEIVGATLVSGVLMTVLGITGWVGWLMARIPMPVVMGMVAGVFLPFGLGIIKAFEAEPVVATVTTVVFVALARVARLGRIVPPVLGALAAGFVLIWATGRFEVGALAGEVLVRPHFYTPQFTLEALIELVVPLALTVITIQNAQGISILRMAGFPPPTNLLTVACGLGTLAVGVVGSVPACVTGPSNAMINASGARDDRYVGGMAFGALMLMLGLFSPLAISFALALPKAFVALLGGLAMLRVLESAFLAAFGGGFSFGALVAFLVTVADITLFNVGAAFWGLVFGFATAWVFERKDFAVPRSP
ncbi:MAG: benzoate/H(+) symporter BenE family transporter [Gammaproteobacteria bacterium]